MSQYSNNSQGYKDFKASMTQEELINFNKTSRIEWKQVYNLFKRLRTTNQNLQSDKNKGSRQDKKVSKNIGQNKGINKGQPKEPVIETNPEKNKITDQDKLLELSNFSIHIETIKDFEKTGSPIISEEIPL